MRRNLLLIAALLLISKISAEMLKPTEFAAYINDEFDLETIIPREVGDWSIDESLTLVKPMEEGSISDLIYDQTLYRGFRNKNGQIIMLVLAYGQRQNDDLQVHLPEVCYVANGFKLLSREKTTLSGASESSQSLPVLQLETQNGRRFEPITYWTRIGDTIPSGTLERQWVKLKQGLSGEIPDGVLVRVSSINKNSTEAFELHRQFIATLLNQLTQENRKLLIGKFSEYAAAKGANNA